MQRKRQLKISEIQYPSYKMITLNEMESKYVDKGIDWTTYSSRLNVMLSSGLITKEDWDGQILKSSNDTISNLEDLLVKELIGETDFKGTLKEMMDEGRINEARYNQELSKFNIST